MDCFYAAVHMRDDPSLRGKPVIIGGRPESRGVVAAASYEVRRYGVHSAMPSSRALRLCPEAVFIPPDFRRYSRESEKIFAIYREITPLVQAVSIDEAYLDVTDHLGEAGSATAVAREIRRRVREERGLTVSVGVGPNRLIAKIASDFHKPDGLTVVPPGKVQAFLDPLPVRRLHGVGPATEKALGRDRGARPWPICAPFELESLSPASASTAGSSSSSPAASTTGRSRPTASARAWAPRTPTRWTCGDLAKMEEEVGRMAAEVADGPRPPRARRLHGHAQGALLGLHDPDPLADLRRAGPRPPPRSPAARDLLRSTEAASRPGAPARGHRLEPGAGNGSAQLSLFG